MIGYWNDRQSKGLQAAANILTDVVFFIATSAPACVCTCDCRYTLTRMRPHMGGWFRPLHGFNLARQLLYSSMASASSEVHKRVSNIEISGYSTLGLHAAVPASTTLINVAGW